MAPVNWEATTDRARDRLSRLSQEDKTAIARNLPRSEYEFRAGFSSRDVRATAAAALSPDHGSSPG